MSRTSRYLQKKAAQRIPTPLLDAVGRAVLRGVDLAVDQRWDRARRRAAAAEGDSVEERVRSVTRSFRRELTSVGAAAGASAAAPGLGTAAAVSVVVAEAGWFALRTADLVMTVGAVYGHVEASREERRAWVLAILAFGESAADRFADLAQDLGDRARASGHVAGPIVAGLASGDAATVDALRRLNSSLASNVVARFGSRRGAVTIGTLLPFGVGAVVGGGANWGVARSVAKQSRHFFERYHQLVNPLPPPPTVPPPPSIGS